MMSKDNQVTAYLSDDAFEFVQAIMTTAGGVSRSAAIELIINNQANGTDLPAIRTAREKVQE